MLWGSVLETGGMVDVKQFVSLIVSTIKMQEKKGLSNHVRNRIPDPPKSTFVKWRACNYGARYTPHTKL